MSPPTGLPAGWREMADEKVKAVRYRLTIYMSITDWSHGHGGEIVEYFIPSERIYFNLLRTHGGFASKEPWLNVFRSEEPRSMEGAVEVPLSRSLVSGLKQFLELKETLVRQAEEELPKAGAK